MTNFSMKPKVRITVPKTTAQKSNAHPSDMSFHQGVARSRFATES